MITAPRPSGLRRFLDSAFVYRVIAFVIFATLWQVLAASGQYLLIPTFTETVGGIAQLVLDPAMWEALWISNQAFAIGFAISIVGGIPIGLAMGRFRTVARFTDVYVNIMLVIPMAATVPLLLMSTGIGLTSRVILVVLFAITMVIVNTQTGVRQANPSLIEMAQCFGASERQIWQRILIPGALPAIMAGVRIGLGRAFTGMVVVELLLIAAGVGNLILKYEALYEPELLYGLVVIVVCEALLLISIVRWIERIITPWSRSFGARE